MKKSLLLLLVFCVITSNIACSKANLPKEDVSDANQNQAIATNDNTEIKPETTPETKPEATTSANPEATTSSKPETKPEATTATKPEATPKVTPKTTPSTKPQATPKVTPIASPKATPEIKPEPTPTAKPENSILKGELKDIIEKIYSIAEAKLPKTSLTEVTAKNSEYFIGTNKVEFTEALASEPLIGSYAHSLVVLRVKDGADIDKIKAEIKNNVDPRKWICVGVEPEQVIVDNIDNLIILIVDNESEKLHKAFLSLAK